MAYPNFELGKSRYDQSTFGGRLKHFIEITDPRTLFTSKKELDAAISLLDRFKDGNLSAEVTDQQLWEAQKIKQAIIHPDTGKKIPMPFRMSGFVPFGSPIVVGLLLQNPTMASTIFWQWLNQSHNACVNYSNRNASKKAPISRFITGYVGAVTSAVGIAVLLNIVLRRAHTLNPATKMIVQKFVPFPAVATASTCNVILMRKNELSEGIEVFDSKDNVVGTSKVAARNALRETAITRMFLPAPIFLIPPTIMTILERKQFLMKRPKLHLPINAMVTTLTFAIALPIAIALFPQISSIKRQNLEENLKSATEEDLLFYNKGL